MTVSKVIDAHGGILVGHDGSASSNRALAKAVRLAVALKTHVTVVRAWSLTTAPRPASWVAGYMPPMEEFEAATLAALERDVASVRRANPDVPITLTVVHGSPSERLVEASESVELIVVGRRGRGGFAGLVLGSVSEQVIRHARCSVFVAKPEDGETDGAEEDGAEEDGAEEDERDTLAEALASELRLDTE